MKGKLYQHELESLIAVFGPPWIIYKYKIGNVNYADILPAGRLGTVMRKLDIKTAENIVSKVNIEYYDKIIKKTNELSNSMTKAINEIRKNFEEFNNAVNSIKNIIVDPNKNE